jgi:hypothetical protein
VNKVRFKQGASETGAKSCPLQANRATLVLVGTGTWPLPHHLTSSDDNNNNNNNNTVPASMTHKVEDTLL